MVRGSIIVIVNVISIVIVSLAIISCSSTLTLPTAVPMVALVATPKINWNILSPSQPFQPFLANLPSSIAAHTWPTHYPLFHHHESLITHCGLASEVSILITPVIHFLTFQFFTPMAPIVSK